MLSSNCISMSDTFYLQLKSDIGNNNIVTTDRQDNILEVIPIPAQPYGYILHTPINSTKYILHSNTLNSITISLIDNLNRDVDLNGLPFYLTIKIEIFKNSDIGLPTSSGRDNADKTNLEQIVEDPSIIDKPSEQYPITVNDFIEFGLINKMIAKNKRSNKQNKHK